MGWPIANLWFQEENLIFLEINTPGPRIIRIHLVRYSTSLRFGKNQLMQFFPSPKNCIMLKRGVLSNKAHKQILVH